MSQKVLLVDTNFSSQPIYSAMVKMGYEVHVVGGNPEDALAKTASRYWELDYSDVEKLKQLVEQEAFDFIVPGCTDRSYASCAMISDDGRYPGIESLENDRTINLKQKFRTLVESLGLDVPKRYEEDSIEIVFPVIVKPVDSFSGKGITVVNEYSDLALAISEAKTESPSGLYLIEEFIQGQLYSYSSFIEYKKVIAEFVVREDSSVNPFVVDTSTICVEFCGELKDELRSSIERIAEALYLKDGLVHTQFIERDKRVYLIEMTRRCPGDLYSQLIELQTGYPYVENYLRPFLATRLNLETQTNVSDLVVRHTITSNEKRVLNGVSYQQGAHMLQWTPLMQTGEFLFPSPNGRVGIAFIKCHSKEEKSALYTCLLKRSMYEIF